MSIATLDKLLFSLVWVETCSGASWFGYEFGFGTIRVDMGVQGINERPLLFKMLIFLIW